MLCLFINFKMLLLFLVNLFNIVYGYGVADHNKIIACYYTSWAVYRSGAGSYDIFDIEPSLCTHLIYSFVGLDDNSYKIKHIDAWQDLDKDDGKGAFRRFVALKEKHKHLKTTIAIGGWNEGSAKYSKMAANPELRRIFVKSVVIFLTTHKFDGLEISWEYPTQRGGRPEDRKNYIALLKDLKEAFEPNGLILTASLKSDSSDIDSVYDLIQANFYLDFIHIMGYDYHGPWDSVVGSNAPIRGKDENDTSSVEYSIKYLISHGITPNKLILGLPMYGRTYIFTDPNVRDVVYGETTTETNGFTGPFSEDDGFIGYNEICYLLANQSSQWIHHWHDHTSTPYLRDDGRFITYDSPRSIAIKVKLALDYGLGGFLIWSLTTDDFRGTCDEDTDTYKDFIERFNKISTIPLFGDAVVSLYQGGFNTQFYGIYNGKLHLRLPKPKFSNYPLLRTVNEATTLASEEQRVINEMERIKLERLNEIENGNFPCVRTCTEVCFFGPHYKRP